MQGTRRRGLSAVPSDLDRHLNEAQLSGLHKVRGYGWNVKFVRRAMIVLVYQDGTTLGVLEEDGTLNHQAKVFERSDTPSANDPQGPRGNKFIV